MYQRFGSVILVSLNVKTESKLKIFDFLIIKIKIKPNY